jgi:hypothetical protein
VNVTESGVKAVDTKVTEKQDAGIIVISVCIPLVAIALIMQALYKNRCRKLSVENNGADRTDTVKRQKVLRFSPEEGLYFSRIFVPLVSSQVLQKLKDSGLEAQKELMNSKKFPFESWKIHDCLHISLSREFVLQKHYVDSFKNLNTKKII